MRSFVSNIRAVSSSPMAAVVALALTAATGSGAAYAAGQGAGGGSTNESAGAHGGAKAGEGGQKGAHSGGQMRGKGGKSLSDIFRSVTGEDDDSDRPAWAMQPGGKDGAGGGRPPGSGSKKGDLFGDLWVILRDENGVPILSAAGFVQPLDINGDLIPLDEEGAPLDDSLVQEVELGRLNVGRAPTRVLDRRADEVVMLLNDATALSLDAAGRLVVTTEVNGIETTKTIDSPLENLAIYVALMTDGSIPGVTDLPGTEFDFLIDGVYDSRDLTASAAFLAAATDKTSAFTTDEIAYINAFLDVNTTSVGGVVYSEIDYSNVDYDRAATYGDVTTTVLIEQSDGSFVPTEINIYEFVFNSAEAEASDTLAAYALMADDSRTVINFIHEFEVPSLLESN